MKRIRPFIFLLLLISFVSSPLLPAQSASADGTYFDMSDFPLWARDLRRGEIIAFGAFPFAYILANFAFDSYRLATNGWDRRYAPWPFNASPTIEQTQGQKFMTLGLAAGTAIVIAVVDHGIMRARRNRLERENRNLPEESPIIIRRTMYGEETDPRDLDSSETEIRTETP